ncbi:MAG: DUF2834 domain-containing protein [Desulfobacteraceae bacterium]|nr:MAG: DUF2834 domain-containing protein [Desulfobacteraceae bacterium]
MQRNLLIITLIALSTITILALKYDGLWGIFAPNFQSFAEFQIYFDLVIVLGLFLVWMWRDATAAGCNPWPWLLLTLSVGSIGPLVYLIAYGTSKADQQ